jgi:hypothetical protein
MAEDRALARRYRPARFTAAGRVFEPTAQEPYRLELRPFAGAVLVAVVAGNSKRRARAVAGDVKRRARAVAVHSLDDAAVAEASLQLAAEMGLAGPTARWRRKTAMAEPDKPPLLDFPTSMGGVGQPFSLTAPECSRRRFHRAPEVVKVAFRAGDSLRIVLPGFEVVFRLTGNLVWRRLMVINLVD